MRRPGQNPLRAQLNAAVRALERKDRAAAVALLDKFGVLTTARIPAEQVPAVLDACTEALSNLDGAAP